MDSAPVDQRESLSEHRNRVDQQLAVQSNITWNESPIRLRALALALRTNPDTCHCGVSKTTYHPWATGPGFEYLDPKSWDEDIWREIEEAAIEEVRNRSAAHLADLAWSSPRRTSYKLAQLALGRYIAVYKSIDFIADNTRERVDYLVAIYRSLEISRQIGQTELHQEIVSDILSVMSELSSYSRLVNSGSILRLFQMAHDRYSHFSGPERDQIAAYVEQLATRSEPDEYLSLDLLHLRRDMARSRGKDGEIVTVQTLIVDHLLNASLHCDSSPIATAERMRKAVIEIRVLPKGHSYKEMVPALERGRMKLMSDESQYTSFTTEIRIDRQRVKDFLNNVELPVGREPIAIATFLLVHVPDRSEAAHILSEQKASAPILHMIPHRPVWPDGAVETVLETEKAKDEYFVAKNTVQFARILSPYLLMMAQDEAIQFDCESVSQVVLKSELVDHRRDETILAGMRAYFDGRYRLAVSLLALEFEPAVRFLAEYIGESCFVSDADGSQRAMYLNELLGLPSIAKHLGENWTLLVESLLLQEGGSKLRHRVAHGRDVSEVACQEYCILLVALFLGICNLYGIASD